MWNILEDRVTLTTCDIAMCYYSQNKYPESHGWKHIVAVVRHVVDALAVMDNETRDISFLAVVMAAILHEVDDRKYAKSVDLAEQTELPNTRNLLLEIRDHLRAIPDHIDTIASNDENWESLTTLTLQSISWVSAHANGNDIPEEVQKSPRLALLLLVRYADRLEASGWIGVFRCFAYSAERGRVAYGPETPHPQTEEELKVAMEGGFERYRATKGESASMIDHYFDKLLHLCMPGIDAKYLSIVPALAFLFGRLTERADPLKQMVMMPRARLPQKLREVYERYHDPEEDSESLLAFIESIQK